MVCLNPIRVGGGRVIHWRVRSANLQRRVLIRGMSENGYRSARLLKCESACRQDMIARDRKSGQGQVGWVVARDSQDEENVQRSSPEDAHEVTSQSVWTPATWLLLIFWSRPVAGCSSTRTPSTLVYCPVSMDTRHTLLHRLRT